jgi:hypothetical protein
MTTLDHTAHPSSPEGGTSRAGLIKGMLALVGIVGVLLALVHWGGTATPGPLFAFGVGILIAVLLGFGGLAWYLYLSPMPASQRVKPAVGAQAAKQLIIVLTLISGMLFLVGLSWDENWHRQFGVSDVIDDFWWRPHLLMYGAIGLMALFAFGGMFTVIRGRGTLRQRFRREPQLGILALACGYMAITAPVDPIWHRIYGLDITAWSLPHLSLAIGIGIIMLSGCAVQLSLVKRDQWRFLGGLTWREGIAFLFLMMALMTQFQVFTLEWDGVTRIMAPGSDSVNAFWDRPEWIFPVVVIMCTILIGQVALHTTRRIGAASVVGIGSLLLRFVVLNAFGSIEYGMSASAHILAVAPLVALDIVYALRRARAGSTGTLVLANLGAGIAMCLVSIPLIPTLLIYPRLNETTLPAMIVGTLIMALGAGWLGGKIGAFFGSFDQSEAKDPAPASERRTMLIGLGALFAAIAFIIYFIGTATPPVI